MNSPVSVVMPTYNGAEYVDEALESVFRQRRLPGEIIVVDDASQDDTPRVIERAIARAPVPMRLIRLAKNNGSPSRPTNVGIASAAGEFIAVLDHDDVFTPEKLADEVPVLQYHPELVFVSACCGPIGEAGRMFQSEPLVREVIAQSECHETFYQLAGDKSLYYLFREGCWQMGFPGFLFRKRHWELKGGIDERFGIADHEFLCWLSNQGPAAFIPRVHYLRRMHARNLSNDQNRVGFNFVRAVYRYGRQSGGPLSDPLLTAKLRDQFAGIAYWLREGGHFGKALECYWLAMRLWGPRLKTFRDIAKLPLHWFARKCTGHSWTNEPAPAAALDRSPVLAVEPVNGKPNEPPVESLVE